MPKIPKFIWSRLKSMRCPGCNKGIAATTDRVGYGCEKCAFFISKEDFDHFVEALYNPKKMREFRDNPSELNNLGFEKMTDDFSDSKFLNV